jgi:hypothetical protein
MSNRSARPTRYATITAAAIAALTALLVAIAPAANASAGCPNEQFRTGFAANLPDCRAYEQVSPQEKNGGGVDGGLSVLSPDSAPNQAALNGESITYGSQTAFSGADPKSALITTQYLSRRTPTGWTTAAITPRQALENGKVNLSPGSVDYSLFQGFSPDLEYGYLVAGNPAPVASAPAGYTMPYTRNDVSGNYTLLSDATPPVVEPKSGTCCRGLLTEYAGMSTDGSHVIFEANDALTPKAVAGAENLYEWNEGALELVSVLPNGAVAEGRFKFGGEGYFVTNFNNALSNDGKRAFWSSGGPEGQVYMHEITPSGTRTVDISETQKTNGAGPGGHDPNGAEQSHYWAANVAGTLVYLTSPEQLNNEATSIYQPLRQSSGGTDEGDLYQYNVETGKLTDLTPKTEGNVGERAGVQGVIGASEDGTYVYFAATGVLAKGAVSIEPAASYKADNIYVWHEGEIKLVGTTDIRSEYRNEQESEWGAQSESFAARVSPNGRYLAFTSVSQFGDHNVEPASPGACGTANMEGESITLYVNRFTEEGKSCMEVYVYDAASSELNCASCAPGGLPSTGDSYVPHSLNLEFRTGWQTNTEQQRYLFNNGRLFFDSTATLVPGDTNGREDVYEWEPAGLGGCTGASACVSLISGGDSAKESQFVDADAEGNNAFFVTFDRLVGSDGDEDEDLYDARIDGGLLAPTAPPCQGEACKPAISAAPSIYGAPTSQTFSGAGNPFAESFATSGSKPAAKQQKSKSKAKRRKRSTPKGCRGQKQAKPHARCKRAVKSARTAGARERSLVHRSSGDRRGK